MRYLIVGASSGLGRALAEELAEAGHSLLLIASDERDLQALAANLRLVHLVEVDYFACHLQSSGGWLGGFKTAILRFGSIDGALLPIGLSLADDLGPIGEASCRQLLEVNFLSVSLLVAELLPGFMAKKAGTIVGFGSIASLRGRGSNMVYAAAKRALTSYFESLRHLTSAQGLKIQFYQLGYLDTQLAFGKKLLFPVMSPKLAARKIRVNLERSSGEFYLPRFWRFIGWGLRLTPWPIFRRLQF